MSASQSLEELLEIIPLATIVVAEDGAILLANELVAELLGWETKDLIGQELEVLIPERFRLAHADHFVGFLTSGVGRRHGTWSELWARHKDGVELPVNIALQPVTRAGATVVVATLRDLTEQRRTEGELRRSERRFRIAATHAADIIQEANVAEDRMTFFGDIDGLWGYQPGGFPRTLSGLADVVHPDDLESFSADFERFLAAGGGGWSWRYRVRAADGSYRHILDRGSSTVVLDGRVVEGVGVITDITEQVTSQQELEGALAAARENVTELARREGELQRALSEIATLKDRLAHENVYLREELREGLAYDDVVGESEPWQHVLAQIQLVAGTDSTVLITGETGTGKECLARLLHSGSERRDHGLVRVNCAALPGSLIESELFGHEKGAFSGADHRRQGRFELADRGTLFLDEIGELPLELQAKLLHCLQTGDFERLGSSNTQHVDVRVIAASNRDLTEEVRAGRFRSDLFYRLAVFPIEVPPLRRRRDDIPLLATYFLSRHNARYGKSIDTIPEAATAALVEYDWPGNVRELENLIERAFILSSGSTLWFDAAVLTGGATKVIRNRPSPTGSSSAPSRTASAGSASLEDVEREHILAVLEACHWRVKGNDNAAERLGLKEGTLRARMKKLGVQRPRR